jgi:hypothetical protein
VLELGSKIKDYFREAELKILNTAKLPSKSKK